MNNNQMSNLNPGSTYYPMLDIAKFILACLVVSIHASPLSSYSTFLGAGIKQFLARLAVPFFFSASGFLWFRYDSFFTIPKERKIQYISRILILLGTWTLICRGFDFHLWYLRATVIGGLLISCFSSLKVSIHKVFGVSICLFIIGLFRNTYYSFLESICSDSFFWRLFNSSPCDYLFGNGRNGLCCGFLFMMIGVEFAELKVRFRRATFGILFLICFALHSVEVLVVHYSSASYSAPDYYAMALPSCFCLLGFLLSFQRDKDKKFTSFFRVSSGIVYFSHPVFINAFSPFIGNSLALYSSVLISCVVFSAILWYIENRTHSKWFRLLY